MIYFAYGSNVDPVQWRQRCPGSDVAGVARLAGHRLVFPRRSPVRGCAVASVEPDPAGMVWGVLYRMAADDLAALDAREGYFPDRPKASRYRRVAVTVTALEGRQVDALTYLAIPSPDPGLPSAAYLRHIVDGAVHHGFPEAYIAMLRTLPAGVSG
ncbi:MAG: gamma-glutamylcyclotransferase [Bauldia sp.]|nr:gamma-glutamylcyclotransferase [Bauldia sp.]